VVNKAPRRTTTSTFKKDLLESGIVLYLLKLSRLAIAGIAMLYDLTVEKII
jgi:hypothetical protein